MNPGRILVLITALLIIWPNLTYADEDLHLLPGDPREGMKVFADKGCIICHSVFGGETKKAADLGKTPADHLSAPQMASAMWNHAPQMWKMMEEDELDLPRISQEEMTDLISFIYSIRLLDEPGDPNRGKTLLAEKHCMDCHNIRGEEGAEGPDLGEEARHANPVLWIQTMWNHGPRMEQAMNAKGFPWPQLRNTDIIDILSYIRSVAPPQKTRVYLLPPDPRAGQALFSGKGCSNCHAIYGKGGQAGPDIGEDNTAFPRTLSRFAERMWNHAPDMWKSMKKEQVQRPEFTGREMADLISFIYSVRFFGKPGDSTAGAAVFSAKKCRLCHTSSEREGRTDSTIGSRGRRMEPAVISRLMWNHGLTIFTRMKEMGIPWPEFKGEEMADLIESLRTTDFSSDSLQQPTIHRLPERRGDTQ